MVATVLANLLGDRNLGAAVVFALCNSGEAVLIAWLINHHFRSRLSLGSILNVVGLFGAAVVGTAISGVGGTTGFILFHNSGTPFLTTWLNWFSSDALGVVTAAPLVIGLANTLHDRPAKLEVAEGLLVLALLALMSAVCLASPKDYWFTILPSALFAPLLLCLAARCRPVFAAAATFILSLAIVWTITFGIGRLGDPSIPLVNRVYAAQTALLALSVCTLVLAALFAERRDHVESLKNSNHRLQLALDCAELGTWSLALRSGLFENDVRNRCIHGHGPDAPQQTLAEMRSQVHPDDLCNLDAAFEALGRAGGSCRTEYRLAPRTDQECGGRERWVAIEGAVVRHVDGRPVQLLGVTRDITERKHAEAKLQESERVMRELLGALPAAIYVTDAAGRITYCNEGAINLWGARPKLGEDRWSDFSRFYHVDGTPMALEDCPTEIALTQGRAVRGREAILERLDGTRIPVAPYPTPLRDGTGAIVGIVNMTVDISERKKAELELAERSTQLDLASKAARVGSFSVDFSTGVVKLTPGCATIYGLPEGTVEMSREDARRYVHPADMAQLVSERDQVILTQQREFIAQFRIIRANDGEVRWIEARSLLFYDRVGKPVHLIGVSIDFTERKLAEQTLAERNLQLALAGRASFVGSYAYDTDTEMLQVSEGYAAVHGFAKGTTKIARSQWLAGVHPEDVEWLQRRRSQAFRRRQVEYSVDYRIPLPGRGMRWIEARSFISYDRDGHPQRVVGVIIDVTERRQTEKALTDRNRQLELANNIAQVGSYSYDYATRTVWLGPGSPSIYGLPESSVEMRAEEWRKCVYPEDLAQLVAEFRQAVANRQCELVSVFRILRNGEVRWLETRNRFFYDKAGRATQAIGASIDVTERRRAEDHKGALVAELDHRVKNALATVSAVVSHTRRESTSVANFVADLEGRIRSMATTHELLSARRWQGVLLAEIVRCELAPYAASNNTEIAGPEVVLEPEVGQAMAMVLHELATNAAKYGALSTKEGRVSIRWDRRLNGHPHHLVLEWQEIGGPPVVATGKPSYGTSTIRDLIPYEFGGTVDLVLAPKGVRCRLELPADWLRKSGEPVSNAAAHEPLRTRDT
jgi:PAS domain S-box-containing protein